MEKRDGGGGSSGLILISDKSLIQNLYERYKPACVKQLLGKYHG